MAPGLALFIEGAAYALFPQTMKRSMVHVLAQPSSTLRVAGLGLALVAVLFVWMVRG